MNANPKSEHGSIGWMMDYFCETVKGSITSNMSGPDTDLLKG